MWSTSSSLPISRDELLGDAVGEMLLVLVGAHVDEGQDGQRLDFVRHLSGFAAAEHEGQHDDCGPRNAEQQREDGHPLAL
ncbi:MAG: hypothetical protein MUE63_15145 [Xanthomonadales bacterium]|nr:hypothetical protein [Xanthomonadales bacterium]